MTPPLWSTCSSRFPRICLRSHSRKMRRRSLLRITEGQCHKPRPAYRYHITSEFPIRVRSLVVGSFDRLCYVVGPKSRSSFISSLLAYPTVGLSDFGVPGEGGICDRTSLRLVQCYVKLLNHYSIDCATYSLTVQAYG